MKKNKISLIIIILVSLIMLSCGLILLFTPNNKKEEETYSFNDIISKTSQCEKMTINLEIKIDEEIDPYSASYKFDIDHKTGIDNIDAKLNVQGIPLSWTATYDSKKKLYYYQDQETGTEIKEVYIDNIFELLENAKEQKEDSVTLDRQVVQDTIMLTNIPYSSKTLRNNGILVDKDVTLLYKLNSNNNLLESVSGDFFLNQTIPISLKYTFSYPEG